MISYNLALSNEKSLIKQEWLYTPHGYTILFSENHTDPTIGLHIGFKGAGYLYEPVDKSGLVTLMSLLLRTDIHRRINKSFFSRFYYKGITIKIDRPIFQEEYFHLNIRSASKHLGRALSLVTESLKHVQLQSPYFQKGLTHQKALALTLITKNDTPDMLAEHSLTQFTTHHRQVNCFGSLDTLDNISPLDIRDYISKQFTQLKPLSSTTDKSSSEFFSPKPYISSNIVIGAAGNMTPSKLMQHIDTFCHSLPSSTTIPKRQVPNKITANTSSNRQYIYRDIPHSVIRFGQLWTPPKSGQHQDLRYLKCQLQYLLYKRFKQRFSSEYIMDLDTSCSKHYVMFSNGFSVDKQHAHQAIKFVQDVFNDIKEHGISVEELPEELRLSSLKQEYIQQLRELKENTQSYNSPAARYLWNWQTQISPELRDLEAELDRVIALQQSDINQLATTLLNAETLSWVEVGKENHIS